MDFVCVYTIECLPSPLPAAASECPEILNTADDVIVTPTSYVNCTLCYAAG